MSVPETQPHPSIMVLTSQDRSATAEMRSLSAVSAGVT
jgi:hypothetical protein